MYVCIAGTHKRLYRYTARTITHLQLLAPRFSLLLLLLGPEGVFQLRGRRLGLPHALASLRVHATHGLQHHSITAPAAPQAKAKHTLDNAIRYGSQYETKISWHYYYCCMSRHDAHSRELLRHIERTGNMVRGRLFAHASFLCSSSTHDNRATAYCILHITLIRSTYYLVLILHHSTQNEL